MIASLCLLTCAISVGQTSDWQLQPQLTRGQELVYAGTFTEESLSPGVQFQTAYNIETMVLVLDASAQKFDLALLTVVTSKAPRTTVGQSSSAATPSSVRLEIVPLDRHGKLQPKTPASFAPPLEGPPTVECGEFVEIPKGLINAQTKWDANDEVRTPRSWRVDGTERIENVLCVRLVGVQQSDDWDTPRADRASWKRRDTVWISPQLGAALRFERVIERRDAARQEPTHRSVLRCDLRSQFTYPGNPGKLFEDRRSEIEHASKFCHEVEALIRDPEQNKTQLEGILKKIKQYSDGEPPTPYRQAIVQVQKRIELALRGGTIPDPHNQSVADPAPRAAVGQRIPDFVCTDLLTHETQRLQRVLGKPVVVMFYNPATETGQRMLRFGQALAEQFPKSITIFPMAVTDEPELVQKQHKEMNLPFSVLDGSGLTQLFAVDALPRVIVLDGQGVVRAASTGWGVHTSGEVTAEVQKLLQR